MHGDAVACARLAQTRTRAMCIGSVAASPSPGIIVANAQPKLRFWRVFKHAPVMNTQAFPSRDCFNPAIVVEEGLL